jgi:hypothetical protein
LISVAVKKLRTSHPGLFFLTVGHRSHPANIGGFEQSAGGLSNSTLSRTTID